MTRPLSILLLLGILSLKLITTLIYTIGYKIDVLYLLFRELGVGYVHFLFTIPQIICLILAIIFIWLRKPLGYYTALVSMTILALYSTLGVIVRLAAAEANQKVLTDVYLTNLPSGFEVTEQMIWRYQAELWPGEMISVYITICGFTILVALLAIWKRAYFFRESV